MTDEIVDSSYMNVLPRLRTAVCVMGREKNIRHAAQRAVLRQGFILKHVESSPAYASAFESFYQCGFVNQFSASGIDDDRIRPRRSLHAGRPARLL